MGHESNSPSVFSRRIKCPGSKRMEANLPDTDNPHSLRGTAAHEVAAKCLEGPESPPYWLNQDVMIKKVDGTKEAIKMTQEDIEAIWVYYDYIARRKEEMRYVSMAVEERVSPGAWMSDGRKDLDGTTDCGLYGNTEIEVADYKHGVNPVEAENNTQLLLYAIGACARIDWTDKDSSLPVRMTIVQPRAEHPEGPIRSWTLPAWQLGEKAAEFQKAAMATDDPDAPLNYDGSGEDWCRWCKARKNATCPEANKAAMGVFKPQDTQLTTWDSVTSFLGRPADQLTPEEVVAFLDNWPLFLSWGKAVSEFATTQALDGTEYPGFKLVETTTRRKWSLEAEEMIKKLQGVRTREKKPLGKDLIIKREPISIAQAEKQVRPLVTDRVWQNLEKLVIKPKGKPTLVPTTDKRPSLKTAEQVFQPVTEAAPWE